MFAFHQRLVLLSKTFLTMIFVSSFQFANSQDYNWAPDFPVGSSIIEISAQDQNGAVQTFKDLVGEKGMLFMLSRSFDWWPFCKDQLVQLAKISDQFKDVGVNIAAMTYDSVEMLKSVEEDEGSEFTLLKDTDISHVNALGILNEDYEPGSRAYGVPHPGIFIITPDGVIRAKFAEEGFRARPDFDNVLEAAANL